MKIDMNTLTLGELEVFEERAGVPFASLSGDTFPIKAVRALVFIVRRRDDPEVTWEQIGEMRLTDVQLDYETDPTSAAG